MNKLKRLKIFVYKGTLNNIKFEINKYCDAWSYDNYKPSDHATYKIMLGGCRHEFAFFTWHDDKYIIKKVCGQDNEEGSVYWNIMTALNQDKDILKNRNSYKKIKKAFKKDLKKAEDDCAELDKRIRISWVNFDRKELTW